MEITKKERFKTAHKQTIKMHNAKILPRELVGVGQKILGYNDLYHGYMLYINQN